jgi:hypothetical protein
VAAQKHSLGEAATQVEDPIASNRASLYSLFYRSAADVVYFLDIHANAAKEDLTPADKQQLKELVNRLRKIQ